jgi:hypothetical protein
MRCSYHDTTGSAEMGDCIGYERSMIQHTPVGIDFKSALEESGCSKSHKSIRIEAVITAQNNAF